MDPKLLLKAYHTQLISQKQLTALLLLGCTNAELRTVMEEENLSNPFAEIVYPAEAEAGAAPAVRRTEAGSREPIRVRDIGSLSEDIPQKENATPAELVLEQLNSDGFSRQEWKLLGYILAFMDDDGYLRYTSAELAELTGASEKSVAKLTARIKTLEPRGIGAYDLAECLLLQLGTDGEDGLAARIVKAHLEDMALGRYGRIASSLGEPETAVKAACARIRRLAPKPLNGLTGEPAAPVVPDLLLREGEDGLTVSMNDAWIGVLRRNDEFASMPAGELTEEDKKYIRERKEHLSRVMNGIEYRRNTVLRVTEYLVGRQMPFLLRGEAKAPVSMTETAEALSLSVSTVSRAVKGKYLETPRGTFSLKTLFSGALPQENGTVSADALEKRIRAVIAGEPAKKPYSDRRIAELLAKEGIEAARRTVAKYRERMNIPCAAARKEL